MHIFFFLFSSEVKENWLQLYWGLMMLMPYYVITCILNMHVITFFDGHTDTDNNDLIQEPQARANQRQF